MEQHPAGAWRWEGDEASPLSVYVPELATRRFVGRHEPLHDPQAEQLAAAVLFADISGFTALIERLAQTGSRGVEELTELLNSYFGELVRLVVDHGGDVVKFVGDALVALWPAEVDLPAVTARGYAGVAEVYLSLWETDQDFGDTRQAARQPAGPSKVRARLPNR